jgi:hypothetical protein
MLLALLAGAARGQETAPAPRATVIVVVGAPGEAQFGAEFSKAADAWADACKKAGVTHIEIGRDPAGDPSTTQPATQGAAPAGTGPFKNDRQRFQEALTGEAKGTGQLWLVFLGHGTFDGKEAKFNLRDLDFSDAELAAWLKPMNRPIALIECSSASAPFLAKVSAPGRVVITATRTGTEFNYARFGSFMADAIINPSADLDKDGQISLLESFLTASRATQDFYATQGRLATEHALLDDTGDGQGTPAEFFQGTRATRAPRQGAAMDGARAHQWFLIPSADELALTAQVRAQRDSIELKIEALRAKKSTLTDPDYYAQLDALLVALARIQIRPENPGTQR